MLKVMRKITTDVQKEKIKALALKGTPDKEIAKKIGVSYSVAAKYSTKAWEEKFNQKS